MYKRILSILLTTTMLFGCSCAAEKNHEAKTVTEESDTSQMSVGETYHGFRLNDIFSSRFLSSDIYTFKHEKSGADLVYTKNSDPEVSFCIAYRTPYVDETDTNHVFEHAIIVSSAKYPSQDLFFDLANKSYNTYINAHTEFLTTYYPAASMSQDQLMTLMDAYMSCMVEPDILKNENFFDREAIRFELDDPDGDIGINGTVYAEDYGFLTEISECSLNALLDNMFPGQIASNMIGMAEYHYDDLTYEHTVETYERCYHFDNSLISLYGDLDIDRFLEFLDTEYLSKYEVYGTDLSQYEDPHTEDGYVEKVEYIPAYEGDYVENSGCIYYAIDMEDASDDELLQWDFLANLINNNASYMNKKLIEEGISNPVFASIATDIPKPMLMFSMENANEDQMQSLKEIVNYTLSEIAQNGIQKEIFEADIKKAEFNTIFLRDSSNVGITLSEVYNRYWAKTGKLDYYKEYERILDELIADDAQQTFKKLAGDALTPARSVLIACIPKPGLAEEYDKELEDYLKTKKEQMSEEEIQKLVQKTKDFNEWNQNELSNNDFLIDIKNLPDYQTASFEKRQKNGITYYLGDVDVKRGGSYDIYFDLSNLTREEIRTLMLYTDFWFEANTSKYDTDELTLLESEYLNRFSLSLFYPNEEAKEYHRPMLHVLWNGLNADFEKGLELLMNIMTETDLSDSVNIKHIISQNRENYNLAKADANSLSFVYAEAAGTTTQADLQRFSIDIMDPNYYAYISDLDENLENPETLETLATDMESVRKKAFTRTNLIFSSVADRNENEEVINTAAKIFEKLPESQENNSGYELPSPALKTGIIVEESQNYTHLSTDFRNDENFRGAYIPFIYAANDKYIVPTIRFQMGAYSAGSEAIIRCHELYAYTYSDPNVKESIDVLEKIPEFLRSAKLDEDDYAGYVLNAYGVETRTNGVWDDTVRRIRRDILGVDEEFYLKLVNDMKYSDTSLQSEAADSYEKIFKNAVIATVGNESKIYADKDAFDEIINYKVQ